MADVTLTYKGNTILELNDSDEKVLNTSGKYLEDNILLNYIKSSGGGGGSSYVENESGTIGVELSDENCRIYFNGFTKTSSDMPISDAIGTANDPNYRSLFTMIDSTDLLYSGNYVLSAAYDSDKTTQIGWIGFYSPGVKYVRSWTMDLTGTLGGTFWGVIDLLNTDAEQNNPYVEPPRQLYTNIIKGTSNPPSDMGSNGNEYLQYENVGGGSNSITNAYVKVNGSWQNLLSSDIEDVGNTVDFSYNTSIIGGNDEPNSGIGNNGNVYLKYNKQDYPDGYTVLDYIGVGSEKGSYIDTGVLVTSTSYFEVVSQYTDYPEANEWVFGTYSPNKDTMYGCYPSSNTVRFVIGGTSYSGILDLKKHTYKADSYGMFIDGVNVGSVNWSNVPASNTYDIFACLPQQDSTSKNVRIFSVKIWDNTTLVRNMIPVKRNSDNEVGMYDLVNSVFYTNSGTGSFVTGEVSADSPIEEAYVKVSNNWKNLVGSDIENIKNVNPIPRITSAVAYHVETLYGSNERGELNVTKGIYNFNDDSELFTATELVRSVPFLSGTQDMNIDDIFQISSTTSNWSWYITAHTDILSDSLSTIYQQNTETKRWNIKTWVDFYIIVLGDYYNTYPDTIVGSVAPTSSIGKNGDYYKLDIQISDNINYVEYLESTGAQYINTGIYATQDIDADVKGDRGSGSTYYIGCMLGVRTGAYNGMTKALYFGSHNDYSGGITAIKTGNTGVNPPIYNKTGVVSRHIRTIKNEDGTYTYIGTIDSINSVYSEKQSGTWQSDMPLCMFAFYQGTSLQTGAPVKVIRATIYDSGIPIADYLPCLDTNNVACMWDNISKTYVYNNGTGDFIAGNSLVELPEKLEPVFLHKENNIWNTIDDYTACRRDIIYNGGFTINTTGITSWDASNSGSSQNSRVSIIDGWQLMQATAEVSQNGLKVIPKQTSAYLTQQIPYSFSGKQVTVNVTINGIKYNASGTIANSGSSVGITLPFGTAYFYAYSYNDINLTIAFNSQVNTEFIVNNVSVYC